jgi:hypothetical protein
MHYQRFKKWGDPQKIGNPPPKQCNQPNCTSPSHSQGMCGKHSQQAKRGTLGQVQLTKSEVALRRWRSEG